MDRDPTQPAPGLSQLEALITGACNAGLPVVLRQDGTPRQLPAATDLAENNFDAVWAKEPTLERDCIVLAATYA